MVGKNLIYWKSKKKPMVSKSIIETEYKPMALGCCELLWLKNLLYELSFTYKGLMTLNFDNDSAQLIAKNPIFHELPKHFKVGDHFVREKIESKDTRAK